MNATGALTGLAASAPALLGRWGSIYSQSHAIGIVYRGVFASDDRIGFMLSRPLRVLSAPVTATLATSMNADGTLNWISERLDLAPGTSETDLELAYSAWLPGGAAFKSWARMRLNPGHIETKADFGAGVKLDMEF